MHEKIARLLLENDATKCRHWDFGILHGAIARKMNDLVRLLIKKGASLDLIYAGCTPLCAALTCGKKGRGDVRVVRVLLNAKVDVNKKTAGSRNSNESRVFMNLEVAEKYSNERRLKCISVKYK